jgi:hypothetical protein
VDEEEETEKKNTRRKEGEGEEEHILVFFKQYLPPTLTSPFSPSPSPSSSPPSSSSSSSSSSFSLGTLHYMAHRTLSRQLLQRDLVNICRGLLPPLLSRSRMNGNEEKGGEKLKEEEGVWLFEEASGDRVWKLSEMEKELSEDFDDGDIFVCQWAR